MQRLHRILKPYKSGVLAAEALYRRAVATKLPSSVVKPWRRFSRRGVSLPGRGDAAVTWRSQVEATFLAAAASHRQVVAATVKPGATKLRLGFSRGGVA